MSPSGIKPNHFFSSASSNSSASTNHKPTDYLDQCKDIRSVLLKDSKWYHFLNHKTEKCRGKENVTAYIVKIPLINYTVGEGCHKGKLPKI